MKKAILILCLILLLPSIALADETNAIVVKQLLKTSTSWDGSALPNYPKGTPEITVLRITIQPGAQLPMHYHPVINSGVLLSGELTVITEKNETLHLKAGDSVSEVVNKKHYGKNNGDQPAEIIVVYAGEVGSQITVKD